MNGKMSSSKYMPGGGPQGPILGLLIFIIIFNLAGRSSSNSSQGESMTTLLKRRNPIYDKKCKFMDDLTVAKSIDLKSKLRKANEEELFRPLNCHQRTYHWK